MKRFGVVKKLLAALSFTSMLAAGGGVARARAATDTCHVYVVDVAKAAVAQRVYEETNDEKKIERAAKAAQVIFPEFKTVMGEEELTTKTYRFPGSRLFITASVFYTDESMASNAGADSMMLGVAVSRGRMKDALDAENNAVAELTDAGVDTARVKKYLRVGGRPYMLGMECARARTGEDGAR